MTRTIRTNRKHQGFLVTVALAAAAVCASTAEAASLGKITLLSARNEPLRAEIQVVMVDPKEVGSLSANIASRRLHEESRIAYPAQAAQLQATLERRADGTHVVVLSSREPISEPMFDVLVELKTPISDITRPYLIDNTGGTRPPAAMNEALPPTAVLPGATLEPARPLDLSTLVPDRGTPVSILQEPPGSRLDNAAEPRLDRSGGSRLDRPDAPRLDRADGAPPTRELQGDRLTPSAATATGTAARRLERTARGKAQDAQGQSEPAQRAAEGSVRVNSGDTLASIAASRKPEDVALDRAMLAIFRANPEAFFGSMHQLKADVSLQIPAREVMLSESDTFVASELRRQSELFRNFKTAVAGAAAPATQTEAPKGRGTLATGNEKYDRLVLSKSSGSGATGAEQQAALDNALNEANSRIAELQRNITDLKRLAELKDRQIAQATATLQQLAASGSSTAGVLGVPMTPPVLPPRGLPVADAAKSTAARPALDSKALLAAAKAPDVGTAETKPLESRLADARTSDSKSADSLTGDSKPGDAKFGDTKSGDIKLADGKTDRGPTPMQRIEPMKVRTDAPAPGFPNWVIYSIVGLVVLVGAIIVRRFMKRREAEEEFDSELATHHSMFDTRDDGPLTAGFTTNTKARAPDNGPETFSEPKPVKVG